MEVAAATTTTARPFNRLIESRLVGKPSRRRQLCCLLALGASTAAIVGLAAVGAALFSEWSDVDDDYKAGGWSTDDDDDDDENPVVRLKAEIHALTAKEAKERFGAVKAQRATPPRQNKIDHFVVLYMENHAAACWRRSNPTPPEDVLLTASAAV